MNSRLLKYFLILFSTFLFSSCSEEKIESKNMEQIYAEEGVPVRIQKVESKNFERELTFNTTLSGIRESNANAMIGGRIEKVLVSVGDFVKKDQIIVEFPTNNPSTQYYQVKSAYENAKNTYERYTKLYEVGGISAQDLDNIKTQYEVSKANWESTRKKVKVLAPISGYVTKVAVKESDNVAKDALLATIADLRKLKASIQISEDEINDIKVGTNLSASWQGQKIEGKVTQVDMAMDPITQSFNAYAEFNNQAQKIKTGVTADITVSGGSGDEAITVNRKNLLRDGDQYYVFVINEDKAIRKNVQVGRRSGLYTEILEGLNENDLLIVEGQMFLENNTKVKIIK
ncbi:MAG: efflux RND transporter periplasmic adaptor subunit [Melioribacteraceae bacterium]|nr:efflux RND transporter periplasmic adaptor subunit [Melioribacteraceae bacterium]